MPHQEDPTQRFTWDKALAECYSFVLDDDGTPSDRRSGIIMILFLAHLMGELNYNELDEKRRKELVTSTRDFISRLRGRGGIYLRYTGAFEEIVSVINPTDRGVGHKEART